MPTKHSDIDQSQAEFFPERPATLSLFGSSDKADAALARALGAACECWRSIDGKSRAFLDRKGRWIASDAKALKLLTDNVSGLAQANGVLRAAKEEQANLERLLSVGTGPETLVLQKAMGEGHILMQSSALDEKTVGIILKDTEDSVSLKFASLEDAFGLTPSEEKVMSQILNGHSAAEVAELHGLSINTVRAHLRHCYDKLDVSTREELWRKIHPYQLG